MADDKQRKTTKDNEQQAAEVKDQDKQTESSTDEAASLNNSETGQQEQEQETKNDKPQPDPTPTLAEDYAELKKLHLLKAVMIRQKAGRHPSAEIDALLKRRMNFKNEDFQGPYVVRLISTLLMIFVFAAVFWSVLWILSSGFKLHYFIRLLSTGMATLVAAVAGIAIFYPSSLPDEKILKKAIDLKMKELGNELEPEKQEQKSPEPKEDLLDSNIEAKKEKDAPASLDEDTLLSPMPEGLNKFKEVKEKPMETEAQANNNEPSTETVADDQKENSQPQNESPANENDNNKEKLKNNSNEQNKDNR